MITKKEIERLGGQSGRAAAELLYTDTPFQGLKERLKKHFKRTVWIRWANDESPRIFRKLAHREKYAGYFKSAGDFSISEKKIFVNAFAREAAKATYRYYREMDESMGGHW